MKASIHSAVFRDATPVRLLPSGNAGVIHTGKGKKAKEPEDRDRKNTLTTETLWLRASGGYQDAATTPAEVTKRKTRIGPRILGCYICGKKETRTRLHTGHLSAAHHGPCSMLFCRNASAAQIVYEAHKGLFTDMEGGRDSNDGRL